MTISISVDQARRFLLTHQGLLPAHALAGPEAVGQVFEHLRLLQYDPLNPCGRNIDLVLQSRINDYHPNQYLTWQETQGRGVEGFDKVLCVVPKADWQFLHHGLEYISADRRDFVVTHRAELDAIIDRIRSDGPLKSTAIEDSRRSSLGWKEAGWGKVALETLARVGELVVTRQDHRTKYYDLPERVLDTPEASTPSLADQIIRRIGAVGLLPASGSGGGWIGMGSVRPVKAEIATLLAHDQLVEVEIAGVARRYVARIQDYDRLVTPIKLPTKPTMAFIAPLDNLVWDRELLVELFNFYYRWEVYVPGPKRQYGYYVLPVLYGDQLIGRIEPWLNTSNILEIKGFWLEPGIRWHKSLAKALADCLDQFRQYVQASDIDQTLISNTKVVRKA